jgi:hypothetical protein
VASRIDAIKSVTDALFAECNEEIQRYSSNSLKQKG